LLRNNYQVMPLSAIGASAISELLVGSSSRSSLEAIWPGSPYLQKNYAQGFIV
jgi:hypothetical protein